MNIQQNERISLIGSIGKKLRGRGMYLGTAESCTGGLAAVWCTDAAGSSEWFRGGVVAYANAVKEHILGVDPAVLAAHGAVSAPVVEAMALGALRALGVDIALATSGVAGPGGGSPEKPVGTVWIAVAWKEQGMDKAKSASFVRHFNGDRSEVRGQAALTALQAVASALDQIPPL